MRKGINNIGLILFLLFITESCNQPKSEDDKIKSALIGESKIDDYYNNRNKSFKNDIGKKVINSKYQFFKDGKFEYSANLEQVIFFDFMFEEQMLDAPINVKFKITGSWDLKENNLILKYNFDDLLFLTQEGNGNYSIDNILYKQFEAKLRANLESKFKIIDFDLLKIIIETSTGNRLTMKKSK